MLATCCLLEVPLYSQCEHRFRVKHCFISDLMNHDGEAITLQSINGATHRAFYKNTCDSTVNAVLCKMPASCRDDPLI